MPLASLDGVLAPPGETRLPVTDDAVLRGDGAFEVFRVYAGRPFALEDHYARLERTVAGLRLEVDLGALRREVRALLAAVPGHDGVVRIVLTRGGRRLAMLEPMPRLPVAARVKTVTYAPSRVLSELKTLSYGANMLAGRLAREAGFDDALLVTPHGRILEGPTWTFFWVAGGRLCTPPLSDGILASITRARILEVHGADERSCTAEDVRGAEEAFMASTVCEVLPIAAVDDIALPAAPGPVTSAARAAVRRRIEEELSSPVSA